MRGIVFPAVSAGVFLWTAALGAADLAVVTAGALELKAALDEFKEQRK